MTIEEARGLAAQAWCDDANKNTEMDTNLAESFAKILMRNLRAATDWIPVGERLPHPHVVVIMSTTEDWVTTGCYRPDGKWIAPSIGNQPLGTVTHWQPLPTPPAK